MKQFLFAPYYIVLFLLFFAFNTPKAQASNLVMLSDGVCGVYITVFTLDAKDVIRDDAGNPIKTFRIAPCNYTNDTPPSVDLLGTTCSASIQTFWQEYGQPIDPNNPNSPPRYVTCDNIIFSN